MSSFRKNKKRLPLPPALAIQNDSSTKVEAVLIKDFSPITSIPLSIEEKIYKIDNGLYLSNGMAASDKNLLNKEGIDVVITVANDITVDKYDSIKYELFNIEDGSDDKQTLGRYAMDCVKLIEEEIEKNHNVLIHCNKGFNRSPAIVSLYYALRNNLSWDESTEHVRSIKDDINIFFNNHLTCKDLISEYSNTK